MRPTRGCCTAAASPAPSRAPAARRSRTRAIGGSVRRLAVITGLGPMSEGGSVESVIAGLRPVGWQLVRRPRVGATCADHVVLGPGGAFLVVLHRGGGSVRPEWADEARAGASALARLPR